MNTLPIQTARTFFIGAIALGIMLFLPAWTLAYWKHRAEPWCAIELPGSHAL